MSRSLAPPAPICYRHFTRRVFKHEAAKPGFVLRLIHSQNILRDCKYLLPIRSRNAFYKFMRAKLNSRPTVT